MAAKKTEVAKADERLTTTILVTNHTGHSIWARVTKQTGPGDTSYFKIPNGGTEPWERLMYTKITVMVKFSSDGPVIAEKEQYLNMPAWELTITEDRSENPKLKARRRKLH